jgi:hypothetical protein
MAGGAVLAGASGAWLLRARREPVPNPTPTPVWAFTDFAADGTPDFLRLEDPADRQAFTAWFTFLAEVPYYQAPSDRAASSPTVPPWCASPIAKRSGSTTGPGPQP